MQKSMYLLGLLFFCGSIQAEQFVDIHLHYNWDHQELTTPEEVIATLKKHNVTHAVVSSVPSLDAAILWRTGAKWIYPFFSPYITGRSRSSWFNDKRVLPQARQALASGEFFGLGEMHLYSGLGPRRDNKVFTGLLALAIEFDVPVLIHTEASDYRYFLPVCRMYSKVRFLWAHAGSILGPEQVGKLLQQCSNVWVDMSARDPWHYGSFVSENGVVPANWLQLFSDYPDRFMIGTDPVWNAHQSNRWYEADEGWSHYDKFIGFHKQWLATLPEVLRHKLQYKNALRFLRLEEH